MSQKMPAGKFKAQCLMVMDRVKKYGGSVTITKHGKAVAKVVPAHDQDGDESALSPFGAMKGTIEVEGDLLQSAQERWKADDE